MASLSGQGKCVACGSVFAVDKAGRKAKCPYCGKAQDSRKAVSSLAATMAQQTAGYQAGQAHAPVAAPKRAASENKAHLAASDARFKPARIIGILLLWVLAVLVAGYVFSIVVNSDVPFL